MSYDGKIMRRALARFDEDKQRRAQQMEERRRLLYARIPRLSEIERELSGTMGQIIASALRRGADPMPAIRVIRDNNLDLQQERREVLMAYGYPEDYLDEDMEVAANTENNLLLSYWLFFQTPVSKSPFFFPSFFYLIPSEFLH